MTGFPSPPIAQLAARYVPAGWDALASNPGWLAAVGVAAAAAIVLGVGLAWRERGATHRPVGVALAALRLVAIGAVVAGVLGFQRRDAVERTERSRVMLLVDASASMGLPNGESAGDSPRSAAALDGVERLASALGADHDVRVARFGRSVRYLDAPEADADFFSPVARDTHVGDAINRALEDAAGSPVAAVVLLTDGRSTGGADAATAAGRAGAARIPIHTVGFGPLRETPRVEVGALAAPERVFTGDPFAVTAAPTARGEYRGRVSATLTLRRADAPSEAAVDSRRRDAEITDDQPSPVLRFELEAPAAGEYLVEIALDADAPRAANSTRLEAVERETRVLLVAGGPSRDYRFLRNQLHRDDAFRVDVLLQSALGAVSQDANELLEGFPASVDALDDYDVVVAMDADWAAIPSAAKAALQEWIGRRGGGLLIAPGPVHAAVFSAGDGSPVLARLAPVTLGDDLLRVRLEPSAPTEPSPVRLTQAGEQADFMRIDPEAFDPGAAWSALDGFYARPPTAKPKPAATVFARLGESDNSPALIAEQYYGSGRVAYLATSQTWRLRREAIAWFTRFHTNLLRRLAQGRVLGAASRGRLFFDRDRYEVGDTLRVRLVFADAAGSDSAGRDEPPVLRWRSPTGETDEVALRPVEGQASAFEAEHDADAEGRFEAAVRLPDGFVLSAGADAELSARETAQPLRDEATLRAVAEASGGGYFPSVDAALGASDISGGASLAERTPSRSETRIDLGPPDPAFGRALGRNLLLVAAGALTLEWLLRRVNRLA